MPSRGSRQAAFAKPRMEFSLLLACPGPTLPISLCSLYWFSCTQSWGERGRSR